MKLNKALAAKFQDYEKRGVALSLLSTSERLCVRRRQKTGEVFQPAPGIFARTRWWDTLTYEQKGWCILRSLAVAHPTWVFGGVAAAWVWGFTTTFKILCPVNCVTASGTHPYAMNGRKMLYLNQADMKSVRQVSGIAVCDAYRAIFDCARLLPLFDSLPICNAAVRSGRVKKDMFIKFVLTHKHWRGWRAALKAARLCSPLAESGGESQAYALMAELGFALPLLQEVFVDPMTGTHRRVDFLWKLADSRVVIAEFDGRQKYVDPAMTHGRSSTAILDDEKNREDSLSLFGVWLFRFGYDLLRDPVRFALKLEKYGIPRNLS